MPTGTCARKSGMNTKPVAVAVMVAAMTTSFHNSAGGGGFEPYYPANEQLRGAIQGVFEGQAARPPIALEKSVREALQSIERIEGGSDPRLAGRLSIGLKGAWAELERSRIVGGLGYSEFEEETFHRAETQFRDVVTQFLGARGPYTEERYQAALRALADVQALSRHARRAVPGVSSDDVFLMREKRQKLLLKEPKGEEGFTPRFGNETGHSR